MNIEEKIQLLKRNISPHHAEGRICIDLTDPLTGKVKHRVEGENHVFNGPMIAGSAYNGLSSGGFVQDFSSNLPLVLTDSVAAIDTSLDLVMGQIVGYGIPSASGSGTYKGSYNSANQILARKTLDSVYWKYQYDFTTAQANGTIGTIGLSNQYLSHQRWTVLPWYIAGNASTYYGNQTCDGRYSFSCSTAGIITKYDNLFATTSTIDVSAVVGTTAASTKDVVYCADTGKYGVYVYSATASLRKVYIFSDASFATLETTYTPTNITSSASSPAYIYGNYLFTAESGVGIKYADYVNNLAPITITPTYSKLAQTENINGYSNINYVPSGTMAYGKYLMFGWNPSQYYATAGVVDMSTFTQVAYGCGQIVSGGSYTFPIVKNPLYDNICCLMSANPVSYQRNFGAVSAKRLDTPVVKTSANGMTVTYELEVFW